MSAKNFPNLTFAGVFATLLILSFSPEVRGCTCTSTREGDFRKAKAIFEGIVLSIGSEQVNSSGQPLIPINLRVLRGWKGSVRDEIRIWTNRPNLCSAFTFEKGEKYLVYAGKDMFASSDCNSSKVASSDVDQENFKTLNSSWFRFKARLHI
jgi:hypothetical protein